MKKIQLFFLLLLIGGSLQAQSSRTSSKEAKREEKEQRRLKRISLFKEREEGDNVFEREWSLGARLNTDGYGGFFELGYRKTRQKVTYFQFELMEKKHPKEDRKPGDFRGVDGFGYVYTERPYIFGKQNNFYQAKFGIGQRRLIGGKGNKNGVEVSGVYYGGISIGLLKPYYVMVQDPLNPRETKSIKYGMSPLYDGVFLSRQSIIGGAGFGKGWGELSVVPGLHAKTGIRFDWARFNEIVSALEVGVNAEYYTKKVPIMALIDNKQFFFNAYVSLQFGKRWNK